MKFTQEQEKAKRLVAEYLQREKQVILNSCAKHDARPQMLMTLGTLVDAVVGKLMGMKMQEPLHLDDVLTICPCVRDHPDGIKICDCGCHRA